ncbi:MAG: ABC transporter permease subunit [Planctomycetes bacterium]|nr:ABC transporter permease subunit [Planctomycetota bacterium]
MAAILTAAAVEVRKLAGQRAFLVATLLLLLVCKLIVLMEIEADGAAAGLDDFHVNGFYLMARSAWLGLTLWLVLFYVLVCQSIAGEGERGQLRMLLVRPLPRSAFYLGKLLAAAAAVGVALLLDALLGLAVGGLALGFGDVADTSLQGDLYSAGALALGLLRAYLLTGLALFATAGVGLLVSALCALSASATTVGLLVLVTLGAAGFVAGSPLDQWLVTTWSLHSFGVLEQVASGTSVYRDGGETLRALCVPLATLLLTSAGGLALFRRRDVAG